MTMGQVVLFALSAVYSFMWFLRWARDIVKNRMWSQLGWFSGLVCSGSVAGAVAWGANMQRKVYLFEGDVVFNSRHKYTLYASAHRWQAAFSILNGLEFPCFIIAKLMMLGRLIKNATRILEEKGQDGRGALARVYHVFAAAVVLCSVGSMVALDVAAAYQVQYVGLIEQAAAACDAQGSDTSSSIFFSDEAAPLFTQSGTALSVHHILEAVALVLVSSAYLLLVPLSVAVFRRAEHVGAHVLVTVASRAEVLGDTRRGRAAAIVDDTIQAASEQRRRLVIACLVVLISFTFRAAFSLLTTYTLVDNPKNPLCGFCGPCQTDRFLMRYWLLYTPEVRPIVVALSSPLPLFLSLWIITRAHAQSYAISLNILRARLGR